MSKIVISEEKLIKINNKIKEEIVNQIIASEPSFTDETNVKELIETIYKNEAEKYLNELLSKVDEKTEEDIKFYVNELKKLRNKKIK